MRTIYTAILLLGFCISTPAQQSQHQSPGFRQRLHTLISRPAAEPSKTNYQLELEIQRGDKSARYQVTVNGGAVSTELIDRLDVAEEGTPPRTISFNASLTPFEGEGAEVALTVNRVIPFKAMSRVPGDPAGAEKQVTQFRHLPLSTKVTLFPDHSVVIFKDEVEKVSLTLSTDDSRSSVKALSSRNTCINNLRQIDGAKEQWALEQRKTEGARTEASDIAAFIKGGMPECPQGGAYTVGSVGEAPTCSVEGHSLNSPLRHGHE